MEEFKAKVYVFIPRGDKCEGCGFLLFREGSCEYMCMLFNEWELGFNLGQAATSVERAYKCSECQGLEEIDND